MSGDVLEGVRALVRILVARHGCRGGAGLARLIDLRVHARRGLALVRREFVHVRRGLARVRRGLVHARRGLARLAPGIAGVRRRTLHGRRLGLLGGGRRTHRGRRRQKREGASERRPSNGGQALFSYQSRRPRAASSPCESAERGQDGQDDQGDEDEQQHSGYPPDHRER